MAKPIESIITSLEMHSAPAHPALHPPASLKLALLRAENPSVEFYRYLYDVVGRDWNWVDRKRLSDDALAAIVGDERVEIYVPYVGGVPAGYAELDRRQAPDIELAYFGLAHDFIGLGLGRYLLDWVIRRAWEYGPARLWVHTCTLDHPSALPLYQRMGFVPYRQDREMIDPVI